MTDWPNLNHAYGSAEDLSALLAALRPDADPDLWDDLGSRLCHQGTVYSASFAALPVLADTAAAWSPRERAQILSLAASILISDDVCGGSREEFLRPVETVVPPFPALARESLAQSDLPRRDFIYLLQAMRAFAGDTFWGQELYLLESGEFPGQCPHCAVDLNLVIGEFGFFTTAEEWVVRRETPEPPGLLERIAQWAGVRSKPPEPEVFGEPKVRPGITTTPITPNEGALPEPGRRLHEYAQASEQHEVTDWLRYVFGNSKCPECGKDFEVLEAITA